MSEKLRRLLYIEDDSGISSLVRKRLEKMNFVMDISDNLEKGLALLRKESYSCLLLDHFLPDGTGLDFIKKLNQSEIFLPVIIITGQGDEKIAVDCLKEGAYDYICKDIHMNFLEILPIVIEQTLEKEKLKTEKKELFRKLEESNNELQQFAFIVAHDLRSPLAGIVQVSSLLNRMAEINKESDIKELVEMIDSKSKYMMNLIDSILNYSQVRFNNKTDQDKFDLNEILKIVLSMLVIPSHIQIVIENHLPHFYGNKTHFIQIFQNLISNSVKFMDKPKGMIQIASIEDDNSMTLFVKDNGPGIPLDQQDRVFDLFYKTRSAGSGIGLAVVKRILEKYDGTINIVSHTGEGCAFHLRFPKA